MKKLGKFFLVFTLVLAVALSASAALAADSSDTFEIRLNGVSIYATTAGNLAALATTETLRDYSAFNTWPTWQTQASVRGVGLIRLMSLAGVDLITLKNNNPNAIMEVVAGDSYTKSILLGQLLESRFVFDQGDPGSGQAVDAIISVDAGYNSRFMLGQRDINEQTYDMFVKGVANNGYINISFAIPQAWPIVLADVNSGQVAVNTLVDLYSTPRSEMDYAKIHYEFARAAVTTASPVFNIIGEKWIEPGHENAKLALSQPNAVYPLSAQMYGFGKTPGTKVNFFYNTPATGATMNVMELDANGSYSVYGTIATSDLSDFSSYFLADNWAACEALITH